MTKNYNPCSAIICYQNKNSNSDFSVVDGELRDLLNNYSLLYKVFTTFFIWVIEGTEEEIDKIFSENPLLNTNFVIERNLLTQLA